MRLHIRNMLPFLLVALALCGGMAAQVGGPEARTPDLQVTSWTGRLVDADCMAAKPSEPCDAFAGTASFGLVTSTGASYKLDSKGNQLAKDIMKDYKKQGAVQVNVTGKVDGDTLVVETLNIPE